MDDNNMDPMNPSTPSPAEGEATTPDMTAPEAPATAPEAPSDAPAA